MDFQQMILTLQKFWSEQDCILAQPYDMEKGAGTMNPSTFLRVPGPEPWRVRRTDGMATTPTACSSITSTRSL